MNFNVQKINRGTPKKLFFRNLTDWIDKMLYSDSNAIESFWLIDDVFKWGLIDVLSYLKHEKPMWINDVMLSWFFLLCFSRGLGRSRRSHCSRAFVKAVKELLHTQFQRVLAGRWLIRKLEASLSDLRS